VDKLKETRKKRAKDNFSKVLKWVKNDYLPTIVALVFILGILFLIGYVTSFIGTGIERFQAAQNKCLAAGYSEVKPTTTDWYCVGIRDGNTVTVKVEDLGQ